MADMNSQEKEGGSAVPTAAARAPAAAPGADADEIESGPLSHKVRVDNYFGPLDLLLHLVKEAEIDVSRLSLASVARQYCDYLEAMQKLDMLVAGEFLVVASQLMLIKSRSLVPPELQSGDEDDAAAEDAETSVELIRKLLDYKRFKDRSRALDQMFAERSLRSGRPHLRLEGETEQEPLRNMELWDLVLLYSRLLKSTRLDVSMRILYRDVPIETWMDSILATLLGRGSVAFSELVGPERDRSKVVGSFLALLQLARQQKVRIVQDSDLGDFRVDAVPPAPADPTSPPPPSPSA